MTAGHIVDSPNVIVFQPSPFGLPDRVQRIGCVTQKSPDRTYRDLDEFLKPGNRKREVGKFDFAYIDVTINPEATTYQIPGIHETDQTLTVGSPNIGERVRWLGSETGMVLNGRVVDIEYCLSKSDPADQNLMLLWPLTMIAVEGDIPSARGDSGAAVVAESGKIIGIHCQGGTNKRGRHFTWASRIPSSPQELENGIYSASMADAVTWMKKALQWMNPST
ncbi:hypothetical protein ACWGK1_29505 [Streptomyces wedmorensis]